MARLTAADERPSARPAAARLPSSSAVTKTFIASIRSMLHSLEFRRRSGTIKAAVCAGQDIHISGRETA